MRVLLPDLRSAAHLDWSKGQNIFVGVSLSLDLPTHTEHQKDQIENHGERVQIENADTARPGQAACAR